MSELVKFLLVGFVATFVHYAVFLTILTTYRSDPVAASSIGYFSGSIVSYFMNYKFTFSSKRKHLKAIPIFYVMVLMGFFANAIILGFFIRSIFNIWVCQLLTTISVFLINYMVSKYVVFK